jgi:hypothetical protein
MAAWIAAFELLALGAAAQDRGVAGLEAERGGVGGDVRPALVDDADDAERHRARARSSCRSARPALGDRADRIGSAAHHLDAVRHGGDALVVEREPVEEGRGRARGLGAARSSALAARISGLRARIRLRDGGERRVLLGGRACAPARAPRARPPARARGSAVGGGLDGLERDCHGIFRALS